MNNPELGVQTSAVTGHNSTPKTLINNTQQQKRMQQYQQQQPQQTSSFNASRVSEHSPRVAEHQFFTKMPDINSVENDLIKLLNDFSDSRLKHGTHELHEKLFRKLDSIRDKQEKIAKIHFEQDNRLTESKVEGEDQKAISMRDLEELTRQLEELNSSIHDLHDFSIE